MNRPNPYNPHGSTRFTTCLYSAEGLTSLAATWLSTGVFFITRALFHWDVRANLILAAAQGIFYVAGALMTSRMTQRFGRRNLLTGLYLTMGSITLLMLAAQQTPWLFVPLLLAWMFLGAMNWPAMEALLCHGSNPHEVSRRVGTYNLVWAFTGMLAIASMSSLLQFYRPALFILAALIHFTSAGLVLLAGNDPTPSADAHLDAPPELLTKQELAKRLSRLALPASYTVVYALTPLLGSLPIVTSQAPWLQSLLVSLWLFARVLTFGAMSTSAFWHTRPGVLLIAVVLLATSFGLALTTPTSLAGSIQLLWLGLAQLLLGLAIGIIYAGSLYFGMVLAHGGEGGGSSTEQGGYHEAMIGLGTILGPSVGAAAETLGFNPALGVGLLLGGSAALCIRTAFSTKLTPPLSSR